MKIVREETFGPVVTAIPFKDLDELAGRTGDTTYGLAAGIWTGDVSDGAHPGRAAHGRNGGSTGMAAAAIPAYRSLPISSCSNDT